MKALILSCNTGEGHNSCAKAIKEYYDAMGTQCVIYDALSFISKPVSKIMSDGHVWIYRHAPFVFKTGYKLAERHPKIFQEGANIYRFLTLGTERMYEYINENQYDTVICTHVFSSLMLTDMLKKHPISIETCFVATDYTCSPSAKDSNLKYYFIPDECLKSEFRCESITDEKTIGRGIPVRQMFYKSIDKSEAKQRENIPAAHKHVLVMCGSMGCGPIEKLTKSLHKRLQQNWHLTVVCGTNEKLRKKLEKQYAGEKNIHIKGFVKDMSSLMDSADLYITKPGGISVSEASVKDLPMVFIDAVAGCEEYNRRYFSDRGCAVSGSGTRELTDICSELLSDDGRLCEMQNNLSRKPKYNTAQIIYEKTEIPQAV